MTDNRTPNVPLLRKAVEWVEYNDALPEIDSEWNQRNWISNPEASAFSLAPDHATTRQISELENHCGTAYCVAGYVGQLLEPGYATDQYCGEQHVSKFAADALGIDYWEARDSGGLFYYLNTAADVRRIAEALAGEPL